jgi:NADH dehydrogenase [ubiquinone] 1 alpha subcomplex assembly factor 7
MNKIINILKEKKSVPLDQFIDISLYNKKSGFYMKKNPFGRKGDFITSPLVSNIFSEMIGIWCVSFWEHLGKPNKIIIVELGPGDGSLCEEILKTFKKFENFYKSVEINLLEISNKLKFIQKKKIKNKKVKWINKINQVKDGPIIFIGNEFFDSLPIKQVYKKNNMLFEKYITLSENKNKVKFLYKKAGKKLIKKVKDLNLLSSNGTIEYPLNTIKYLSIIAKKIKKYNGGFLTFDYGYIKNQNRDTIQAVKNHKYSNPFIEPGSSDITSHVNFELIFNFLKKNKLNVNKVVTQSEFLQKIGIKERANILSKNMTFKSKVNMFYTLKRLLDSDKMGSLFKVLFAQKKGKKFSLGF